MENADMNENRNGATGVETGRAPLRPSKARLLRYLFAGGTATFVNLGTLYVFVDIFGWHYLTGAVWAFIAAFCVSFLLQKLWTFKNFESAAHRVSLQAVLYLSVAFFNLIINTALMYTFVDIFGLWYLFGQFLTSGLIACSSYLAYKLVIFKHGPELESKHQ